MASRLIGLVLVLVCFIPSLMAQQSGQSLADVARQERERKKDQPTGKVYTGESAQILALGCYRDQMTRDLSGASFEQWNMTPVACQNSCRNSGYRYAGVQYGHQCFCGKDFGRYGKIGESSCNSDCAGNPKLKCGGTWANSIYDLNSPSDEPEKSKPADSGKSAPKPNPSAPKDK
jgi:hypothetical protein